MRAAQVDDPSRHDTARTMVAAWQLIGALALFMLAARLGPSAGSLATVVIAAAILALGALSLAAGLLLNRAARTGTGLSIALQLVQLPSIGLPSFSYAFGTPVYFAVGPRGPGGIGFDAGLEPTLRLATGFDAELLWGVNVPAAIALLVLIAGACRRRDRSAQDPAPRA